MEKETLVIWCIILVVCFVIVIGLFSLLVRTNKALQKEIKEKSKEIDALKHFVTEYFIFTMKNEEGLDKACLNIVCDYQTDKNFPTDLPAIICSYSEFCDEMNEKIIEEIGRLAKFLSPDELVKSSISSSVSTFAHTKGVLAKQAKLIDLLHDLETENKRRNGGKGLTNAISHGGMVVTV